MMKSETIRALWQAVISQKAPDMARFFTEDAVILWPNSCERFTLPEYLRANCEYPGLWERRVEQVSADGSVSIARVWNSDDGTFRAVSFYQWQDGRISRLEEYWGDVAPAPAWRQALGIGAPLADDGPRLPAPPLSPALLGRCGFCCGVCPTFVSGSCPGCDGAHSPGDCFTRDCAGKRGVPYCTLCGAFPCGELLRRKKATVLDHDWLLWKRKAITGK